MSSLDVEDDRRWVPTHVQVTVLRGRGLRAKGKHGTSDVYAIIQLGREKYSTCVLEKTTAPEWKEECSFELLAGALEQDHGDGSAYPPGSGDLVLTVMHRAVIGLDVFLGQAVIPLNKLFQDRICMKNEWCKLNSKTGKKEKERGDIQVTVQFTKNNLTASMYDLSLGKDKPRSTFGKIKDRIKGKKRSGKDSDEDLPSVIIGGYGPVMRMRNRLPSDGGGEEDYEDDEGGEGRRSKMRNFFLRGKLRKSSDTRSSTSLGSESSESSRGGSLSPTAGISVVVSDLSNSPSNSSNFTADSPDHTADFSPKLVSYPCEFTDESGEISIPVPQPVCINGSQVYNIPPQPLVPGPVNPVLAQVKKRLPLSQSLQNLSQPKVELSPPLPKGTAADGRRWSFDKAGKDEMEAFAAALMQAGQGVGEGGEREESNGDTQGRKQSRTCQEGPSEQAAVSGLADNKPKGWFRSKDCQNRPSQVMSSSLEPHPTPGLPLHPPGLLSWGPFCPPVDSNPSAPLHHTNPFSQCPPPMSPSNPFFSLVQCNPFYEELLADHALKQNTAWPLSPCPSSSYLSAPPSCSNNPNSNPLLAPTQDGQTPQESTRTDMKEKNLSPKPCQDSESVNSAEEEKDSVKVSQKPLHPHHTILPTEKGPVDQKPSNPLSSCSAASEKDISEKDDYGKDEAEWDDFEVFASDRLKPTEALTRNVGSKPLSPGQTNPPLEDSRHPGTEAGSTVNSFKNKNVNSALNQPTSDVSLGTDRENVSAGETGEQAHISINERMPDVLNDTIHCPAPTHTDDNVDSSNTAIVAVCRLHRLTELDISDRKNTIDTTLSTSTHQALCHTCTNLATPSTQSTYFVATCETSPACSSTEAEAGKDDSVETLVVCPEDGNPLITMETDSIVAAFSISVGGDTLSNVSTYDKTSPPGMHQLLNDTSVDNTSQEQNVGLSLRPPKPPRLFLTNNVSPGQDLGFEVSNSNPSTILQSADPRNTLTSLCVSADSPTRRSHQTKEDIMTKEEAILPKVEVILPIEDVHPLAGPGMASKEERKAVPDNISGFCEGQISWTPSFDPFHLETTSRTQPRPLKEDWSVGIASEASISQALPDNFRSPQSSAVMMYDGTASEDVSGNLKFQHSFSEGKPLQRSLSEGNKMTSFMDQPLSFGSNPAIPTGDPLPSVQQHDADLLISSSLTPPSLTTQCSTSTVPFPPPAIVRSSASNAANPGAHPFSTAQPVIGASHAAMPQETRQAANQQNSPHPVKPLTPEEKRHAERSEGRSVLDKLKSSIHPGRSSPSTEHASKKTKSQTEGAGSYYHLTHSELVALLLQREADLHRQRAEFDHQGAMLAKREAELKKIKPQVRDLEDYIDTLLVRIMEQTPTILQVGSKLK
ncbi:hypothetical protein DPEC_G00313610 [Dallia pectoralis]|uniref:Uncharacterized protein n=1 Tax=Dallia pectoralis TaxID=75939 RepID=A0ACC2FC08_DALPE|nr:hypothetical protein DPEC_G00313610 [Dallia pectoralis]